MFVTALYAQTHTVSGTVIDKDLGIIVPYFKEGIAPTIYKELLKDNIKVKEEIGYLPSEIHLYDDLTVREMLDFHATFYKKTPKREEKN